MENLQHDTQTTTEYSSYLDDVAMTIRDDALEQARTKLPELQRELSLKELLGNPSFVDYFKFALAVRVSNAIGAHDKHVEATYIYDPSANPDSESGVDLSVDLTIHLLVQVSNSTVALEGFLDSLSNFIVASLQTMPSKRFQECTHIMDINIVTTQEVELRLGYGALIKSMYAPALKIWERE